MAIIKCNGKLMHFAHIPKCAGTAILQYLSSFKNVHIGFHDDFYYLKPNKKTWNISSPQHIDGQSLSRLFPKTFFDLYFTITRNPFERVISAYKHQKFRENKINNAVSIDTFIQEILVLKYQSIGWLDNHFLSQSSFLYPDQAYSIFQIEKEGMQLIKNYLDLNLLGQSNNTTIPKKEDNELPPKDQEIFLSNRSQDIIYKIYEEDFIRFKYN